MDHRQFISDQNPIHHAENFPETPIVLDTEVSSLPIGNLLLVDQTEGGGPNAEARPGISAEQPLENGERQIEIGEASI